MLLGIETSCDETAAAVVDRAGAVRSNIIYSQVADHQPYGGVVPELASRCHVQALPGVVAEAMKAAGVAWGDLTGIAVTRGPGLATALLTGITYARGLALRLSLPLFGVSHLVGHLQSIGLQASGPARELVYPHLVLLVSGGHTMLVRREAADRWTVLGQTIDDAAGEALDKGARLMGLSYPGGPAIEKAAAGGRVDAVAFPRGTAEADGPGGRYPFTFSGLKTSLLYHIKRQSESITPTHLPDTAASYQEAVVDALVRRVKRALDDEEARLIGCAGGVARNRRLREKLEALGARRGVPVWFAEPAYCADNAAMIAAAAQACLVPAFPDGTATEVDPNLGLAV